MSHNHVYHHLLPGMRSSQCHACTGKTMCSAGALERHVRKAFDVHSRGTGSGYSHMNQFLKATCMPRMFHQWTATVCSTHMQSRAATQPPLESVQVSLSGCGQACRCVPLFACMDS